MRMTLGKKIILIISGLFLLNMLGWLASSEWNEWKEDGMRNEQYYTRLSDSLALNPDLLAHTAESDTESYLERLAGDQQLAYLHWIDPQTNQVIYSTLPSEVGRTLDPLPQAGRQESLFEGQAVVELTRQSTNEQWVSLGFYSVSFVAFVIDDLPTILSLALVLFLFTMGLASVISRRFLKTVNALNEGTQAINEGQFDYRIELTRNDELGDLIHNFNRMAKSLQKYHDEIAAQDEKIRQGIQEVNQARELAEQDRNRFEAILEAIADSVLVVDADYTVQLINAEARALLDIQDDRQGRRLSEVMRFVDPEGSDWFEPVREVFERILAEGGSDSVETTVCVQKTSGKRIPIELTLSAVEQVSEGERSVVLAFRDVGKRLETESRNQKLLQIEELLRESSAELIARDIDEGINSFLARLGEIVDVSRVYIFEYDEAKLKMDNTYEWVAEGIEPQIDNLKGLDADIFPLWNEYMQTHRVIKLDRIEEWQEPEAVEFLKAQDIKSLLVLPLHIGDTTYGFIGFDEVREVRPWGSDRLNALQIASGIISSALKRQDAETFFEEVNKMKTEFVSIVSHQLRTPLTALRWMLELSKKQADNLTEDQTKYLLESEKAVARMIDLVNDLLSLSRMESGKFEAHPEAINLCEMVTQVAEDMAGLAEEKGIRIERDCQQKQAEFDTWADRMQLRQVISNLVSNAVKYTPDNGRIQVRLMRTADSIRFECQDSGIGIPEDQLDRLFSRFFRADNVSQMPASGTGLGLYIAKNIIEYNGGTIGCESVEGKGSTFFFEMPIAKQPVD